MTTQVTAPLSGIVSKVTAGSIKEGQPILVIEGTNVNASIGGEVTPKVQNDDVVAQNQVVAVIN